MFKTLKVDVRDDTKKALASLKTHIEMDQTTILRLWEQFTVNQYNMSSFERHITERDLQMQERALRSRIGAYNAIVDCLNAHLTSK